MNGSLINIEKVDGEGLTKPATTLIEKISSACGLVYEPIHLVRMAKAQAKKAKIEMKNEFDLKRIENRAIQRLFSEEIKKQQNIENIIMKALPLLEESAKPEDIDDDWITNYFDKCKLISDDEMQILWSKILAGEANKPQSFSKRTVNSLSSLDKFDAEHFQHLCSFCIKIENFRVPLIIDEDGNIYHENNIEYGTLLHLSNIGLISFKGNTIVKTGLSEITNVSYFDQKIRLKLKNKDHNKVNIGKVIFTIIGLELYSVCDSKKIDGFFEYSLKHLTENS